MSLAKRPQHVGNLISVAARASRTENCSQRSTSSLLQEADKRTVRTGGHHVACELASQLNMNWVHAPAGIPRGIKPVKRQWWLDFEEPIDLHDEGDTGVALLSRLPMSDVTRLDLPWQECPWRPRLAMAATISLDRVRFASSTRTSIRTRPATDNSRNSKCSPACRSNHAADPDPRRLQHSVQTKVHRDPTVSRIARLYDAVPHWNANLAWRRTVDARRLDLFTRIKNRSLGCGKTPERFGPLAYLGRDRPGS